MIIRIKNDHYNFCELEYLIAVSFLIRIRKEYAWYCLSNMTSHTTFASQKPELIKCELLDNRIIINIKENLYSFQKEEYYEYVDNIYSLLSADYSIPNVDYKTFDEVFFEHMLAFDIPYLYKCSIEEVYLDELRVYSFNKKYLPVNISDYYMMIKNNKYVDICTRTNLINQSHTSRYKELVKRFDIESYEKTENYITLYNDTNIIRDGSHRVAILYHKYGNIKVKIRRLYFTKNNYSFGLLMENSIHTFYSLFKTATNTRWIISNSKKIGVIRSGALAELRNSEAEFLKINNVNTIIDLRNFKDKEHPTHLMQEFQYFNVPIIYSNKKTKSETNEFMQNTVEYNFYLLSQTDKIKRIFDIINLVDGNILIMCTLGRDRTGLVCFLIQMLLGSSDEEIIDEYAFSDLVYKNDSRYSNVNFNYMEAKAKMKEFILAFKEKMISAEKYLLSLGFSAGEIDSIVNKLRRPK